MVKKQIGGAKNGGSREVSAPAPKYYPAEDVPLRAVSKREQTSRGIAKLRSSIAPGQACAR